MKRRPGTDAPSEAHRHSNLGRDHRSTSDKAGTKDLPPIRTIACLQDTELLQQQQGVTSQPGLCFIGLSCQYTRESAVPTGVSFDAAFIARRSRHTQGAMTMTRLEKIC